MTMSHNKEENFNIRPLTTDDAEQYNALLRYALQETEQELEETGWKDDEIKQSKFPVLQRADVLGCFNEGDLVALIAVYPLDMNIYGTEYSVGFVTSVCTYPEYTGHGIMKRLMIQSLTRMREKHRSFALLYPYSIPLYRRLGWEIISNKMTYVVKDTQIPRKNKEPGYVRRVEWDNPEFMALHTRFAEKTHGCLFRNDLAWEEYWRWDHDDTAVAVYYSDDDIPYGYMVYLINSDIMHIKEMIYLNREAQLGLWEYIYAHDSMIDEVHGNNYYSEPIAFELEDSDIKETIRPYAMGRIIDIEQFFGHYSCCTHKPAVCFEFVVTDELLPWNNGSFRVMFENGKCRITDEVPQYSMKMTIGTLTTMLMGYKTAEKLYGMNRISSSPEAVKRLDDTLLHNMPYISDYI